MIKNLLKIKCYLLGHQYKIGDRINGHDWGYYMLKCKYCCKKSDTLCK